MNGLRYDWATVGVLWRRDLLRFWRQPARILGALGQPVIFWAVIGSGMTRSFRLPEGQGPDLGYMEFFYPGVVLMVALFASIFASVSIIEDRHHGFLQSVLAGPASRWALVLGKCLGSCSVALAQIGLFLLLAPLAGFDLLSIDWLILAATLFGSCLGLSALGFAVAWWLDNVQAYHAIQMTFLVPLWVVSGAMFPLANAGDAWRWVMVLNPVSYAVTGVRHALYGGVAPVGTVVATVTMPWALTIVGSFALACLALSVGVCRRR